MRAQGGALLTDRGRQSLVQTQQKEPLGFPAALSTCDQYPAELAPLSPSQTPWWSARKKLIFSLSASFVDNEDDVSIGCTGLAGTDTASPELAGWTESVAALAVTLDLSETAVTTKSPAPISKSISTRTTPMPCRIDSSFRKDSSFRISPPMRARRGITFRAPKA